MCDFDNGAWLFPPGFAGIFLRCALRRIFVRFGDGFLRDAGCGILAKCEECGQVNARGRGVSDGAYRAARFGQFGETAAKFIYILRRHVLPRRIVRVLVRMRGIGGSAHCRVFEGFEFFPDTGYLSDPKNESGRKKAFSPGNSAIQCAPGRRQKTAMEFRGLFQ